MTADWLLPSFSKSIKDVSYIRMPASAFSPLVEMV